jgi:hypothetical protein
VASSGTYAYGPAASNLVLAAFARIGIRRTEITAQHMADAEQESNLVQVKLSNLQPNLWTDELYEQVLTASDGDYDLNARLIAIQAAYITTELNGVSTDRIIWPLSTFEYAAMPNKTQEGPPTSYWYDRKITPTIKLWPVPDDAATYTLKLRVCRQIQDVTIPGGVTLDLPYRWLDVFVADLAYRLARIYAPDKEAARKVDAAEAWTNAATEDQERVPMYICPVGMGGYWR